MPRQRSAVLNRNMDIPEMTLQRIPRVNRVGSRRVEYQIYRPNRLVDAVGDGEPGLGNEWRRIWIAGSTTQALRQVELAGVRQFAEAAASGVAR